LGEVKNDVEELALISSLSKHGIEDVSCGENNSFAITRTRQLYVWGMGTNSQLGTGDEEDVPEPKLLASAQVKDKNILSVNSGGQHSLFVVEVPESTAKPVKVAAKNVTSTTESQSVVSTSNSEAAPKENGGLTKTSSRGTKKRPVETPVIMESDSTTDVNGNSEKDEKMEVDEAVVKRARKRKA